MSLSYAPKVVTNGLVFYYDQANTKKSWLGAPTTNLQSTPATSNYGQYGPFVPAITQSDTVPTTYGTSRNVLRVRCDLDIWGPCFYWVPPALTAGTMYTVSFYARTIDIASASMRFSNQNGSGDENNLSHSHTITTQWQRYTYTNTLNVAKNVYYVWGTNGATLEFADFQIEASSWATPFVNGTRSNTQAILDITNNYTITANSLNYNNDNTFNFNGSNSNLDAPPPNVGNFSIDIVAKWTSSLSDVFACGTEPMGSGISGGTYIKTHIQSNGMFTDLYSPQVLGGGWKSGNVVSGSFTTNTTYNITIVNSGTIWYYYSNGVYLGSYDHTYLANTGSSRTGIFRNHVQIVGNAGYVYAYKQYNQALTAQQVQQNFAAQRGRYGI